MPDALPSPLVRCVPIAASWLIAAAWCLPAGCGEDRAGTLRLTIDTTLAVPGQVDEIRVFVTAARTEDGPLCVPIERSIPLVRQADFPLRVGIEVGAEYRSWLVFRIEGRLGGSPVIFQETRTVWPASGATDVGVQLSAGCYLAACAGGEMCLGSGTCVAVPVPGAFVDETMWDPGVPCDRAAPVLDVAGEVAGDAADASPEIEE
ncbi:MAG: hypothetical protein HY907_06390 [Deltaproteobacteria bacterium]|nr:hypothetical protein [Deltaproteobacteria bacterium]